MLRVALISTETAGNGTQAERLSRAAGCVASHSAVFRVALTCLAAGFALTAMSGCGGSLAAKPGGGESAASAGPTAVHLILKESPADAKGVASVRAEGKPGDEVVVRGWVAGSEEPIVRGRWAFTLIDLDLPAPACSKTPYSYCCVAKDVLLPNLLMVKFVDEQGRTVSGDVREALGLQEGSSVCVRGVLESSGEGAPCWLRGQAVFVQERQRTPVRADDDHSSEGGDHAGHQHDSH